MIPPAATSALSAVIDTNVLLDFWVFDDPGAAPLRRAVEDGRVRALRSGAAVDEFSEVLSRARFDLSNERRCSILRLWDRLAVPVERVHAAPWHCTDPDDQVFLDLAYSARADWLVTRDAALLRAGRRTRKDGLQVLGPVEAARLLAGLNWAPAFAGATT